MELREMIYTSYFANIKNLPENCVPVSIAQWAPKGYHGYTMKMLAPSPTLLNWWRSSPKTDVEKNKYINIYKNQLLKYNPHEVSKMLINGCKGKIPVLVCYEKKGDFCHRHIVAEWFNKNGIECREV